MELRREIGALILFQAPMGRVYRKLLVVVGLLFLAIFSFKLEMGRVKFWHDVRSEERRVGKECLE